MKINVKTPTELEIMRQGGAKLIQIFKILINNAKVGVTLKALDQIAIEESKKLGGKPSFLGYQGYPAAICASINDGIVHCVPDDYALKEGDLLSLDFGLLYKGFHTDATVSLIIGKDIHNYSVFLKKVYAALVAGTEATKAGVKVGEISKAIEQSLIKSGLTIMKQFVGHGVGRQLHEDPTIPNFIGHDRDVILPPNSTIAIEPIAGLGGEGYFTASDGWGTRTTDGSIVAHFEQTVAATKDGPEIITPIQQIIDFTP